MKSTLESCLGLAVCALIITGASSPELLAVELITNGGFETGDSSGWTITDLPGGSGSFYIESSSTSPESFFPTAGPASGQWYAISDQLGPGTHALSQAFTMPATPGTTILSFDMFVDDYDGGPVVDPAGLDHTVSGPNQHARVDLLSDSAGAFDTGTGVLENYYVGIDPQATIPNAYTSYSFDISGSVAPGGSYVLRFAEVDNSGNFLQGVDNVSVLFTPVPEPTSAVIVLFAAAGWARRHH